MMHAAVGLVHKDGSLEIPRLKHLGNSLGYESPYGIRTKSAARRELAGQPGLAAIIFASSETGNAVEFVGANPLPEHLADVADAYARRNDGRFPAEASDPASGPILHDPRPISSKRVGRVRAASHNGRDAEQSENELLLRYEAWLKTKLETRTLQHHSQGRRLEIDAFDGKTETLIEAKSEANRRYIWTAMGQLLDYGRSIKHQHKVILLPEKPEADLIDLAKEHGISIVYETTGGFAS